MFCEQLNMFCQIHMSLHVIKLYNAWHCLLEFSMLRFFLCLFNAEAVSCLDNAVNIFCEIGRLSMAARYLKVYSLLLLLFLFEGILFPFDNAFWGFLAGIFVNVSWLDWIFLYAQEIAELYESEQNIEQAVVYFEKAADFYENEEVNTSANQCKQKVAQYSAQLEQ